MSSVVMTDTPTHEILHNYSSKILENNAKIELAYKRSMQLKLELSEKTEKFNLLEKKYISVRALFNIIEPKIEDVNHLNAVINISEIAQLMNNILPNPPLPDFIKHMSGFLQQENLYMDMINNFIRKYYIFEELYLKVELDIFILRKKFIESEIMCAKMKSEGIATKIQRDEVIKQRNTQFINHIRNIMPNIKIVDVTKFDYSAAKLKFTNAYSKFKERIALCLVTRENIYNLKMQVIKERSDRLDDPQSNIIQHTLDEYKNPLNKQINTLVADLSLYEAHKRFADNEYKSSEIECIYAELEKDITYISKYLSLDTSIPLNNAEEVALLAKVLEDEEYSSSSSSDIEIICNANCSSSCNVKREFETIIKPGNKALPITSTKTGKKK